MAHATRQDINFEPIDCFLGEQPAHPTRRNAPPPTGQTRLARVALFEWASLCVIGGGGGGFFL